MKMLLQDFHLLVVVLLSAIVLSDCHTLHRRQVTVSRCAICDDDTPGQECGTSTTHNSINCLGDTPYCATRVTGEHGNHLKIWKGCASEATCISDWWFGTSTNHACSQAIVTSGRVTSGTVCTFCCHDPLSSLYCNDNLYPNNIATFPNVVSTSVSDGVCKDEAVTSVAPPSVSRCALCDDDTPGQECSGSAAAHGHDSTNCHGNTPYCVTRVTEVGGHLKTWKGCASANTCINDWWMATSTNPACSQASITSGHVTSGTSCTFCCHEPQHGVSSLYCNDNLYPNNIATFPDIPVTKSYFFP